MEFDLRAERERAGLSQTRLASLSGVAASNLSAYESGRRHASPQMVRRLRQAMVRPSDIVHARRDLIVEIVQRSGATNPRVFGSTARGEDTSSSDLDLVVTVPPGGAWGFIKLHGELEEALGIRVDLVSEGGLTAKHADILLDAVPL